MGHLLSAKSSLVPLIDRLNRYPIGLVDSAKLREILSLLFDEREAVVASRFPLMEATLEELCVATAIPPPELDAILESMANKGLVMDLPYAGTTYYLLMPGLIGFMEFTFMRQRADLPIERLARLLSEYLHEQGRKGQAGEFFGSRTPIARALVSDDHIPVTSRITPPPRQRLPCADPVLLPPQEGAPGAGLSQGRAGGGHLHGPRRRGAFPRAPRLRRGAHGRADAREPGLRPLPRPHPCHRQRPRAAVVPVQLLPLLLRADGRGAVRIPQRLGQDPVHRRSRSEALRLLRRVPARLQRQVHRAGCARTCGGEGGSRGRVRGNALCAGQCGRLPRLRGLRPRLRTRRHHPGEALRLPAPTAQPRGPLCPHPLGQGPAHALRGRRTQATLAPAAAAARSDAGEAVCQEIDERAHAPGGGRTRRCQSPTGKGRTYTGSESRGASGGVTLECGHRPPARARLRGAGRTNTRLVTTVASAGEADGDRRTRQSGQPGRAPRPALRAMAGSSAFPPPVARVGCVGVDTAGRPTVVVVPRGARVRPWRRAR